ncbi:MAG: hypothetical protein AC479_08065 [miscellaneous Crenarchaeota group-6 archaeon AD8-1]|nr:MAG: hypothetical protein AC479_08065 [miscellaneous Crenarchaeota group-6 archaeon AD8-1]
METSSVIVFGIEANIKSKLLSMGATSIEKAVTSRQARFSYQEESWISYIAGGMFAIIKKTKDGRFYAPIYH